MTTQEWIDKARELFAKCYGEMDTVDAVIMGKLIETTPTNWISVKDRLPEDSQQVLCFDGKWQFMGNYFRYADEWRDENKEVWTVTHWQPLPAAPTEPA